MAGGWKAILGQVAPTLARAIAGPLAGGAIGRIAGALLGDSAADEKKVAEAVLKANPETLLKLKDLDLEYEKFLGEHQIDLEKLAVEDRASARAREIALRDWMPSALAAVVVIGFLAAVYMVLSGRVQGLKDPTTIGIVGTLIGYVSAKADQVVGYYFGSSAGSARKTELMDRGKS